MTIRQLGTLLIALFSMSLATAGFIPPTAGADAWMPRSSFCLHCVKAPTCFQCFTVLKNNIRSRIGTNPNSLRHYVRFYIAEFNRCQAMTQEKYCEDGYLMSCSLRKACGWYYGTNVIGYEGCVASIVN